MSDIVDCILEELCGKDYGDEAIEEEYHTANFEGKTPLELMGEREPYNTNNS